MDLGYKSIIYTAVNATPRLLSLRLRRRRFQPRIETMSCWICVFVFFFCYLIFSVCRLWLLFKPNTSERLFQAPQTKRALKRVIGILRHPHPPHPSHTGAKHWINCSVWKEKQSITPGLGAGAGLASIGGAAAKHHSPIICDSPQC